ncbi:MAG: methyltransferase domain-containing protein, partial [Kangiellaceae bacterium]|nr:methyltransferase domain-containing protein [Kangiellaceae bacterium]
SKVCDTAIILDAPANVHELPDFSTGAASVQDSAAQLAAGLLDLKSGMQVLDACAAPGGKTGHILENCEGLKVIAVDNSETRLVRVQENLDRLSLSATLLSVDAGDVDNWAVDLMFDRILLDAPCSATGVIRRHPDIKVLRRKSDIKELQKLQGKMLDALWGKLKPEGIFIFATCSILPQENEQQISSFIERYSDIEVISINGSQNLGKQIFPTEYGMDGFYLVKLKKIK